MQRDFAVQYREVLKELPKIFSETRESELERKVVEKFRIGLDTISLLKLDFEREQTHLFIEFVVKKLKIEKYLSDDELLRNYNILRDGTNRCDKIRVISNFIELLREKIVLVSEEKKGRQ